MEINKVQWRMIAKGEKLPCDSFLMKQDGTIPSVISGAGVEIGQDAYYLPVEELRTLPKEENKDEKIRKDIIVLVKDWWDRVNKDNISTKEQMLAWLEKHSSSQTKE